MKIAAIKKKAQQLYAGALEHWDRGAVTGFSPLLNASSPAFAALLPFVLATQHERAELRAFAQAFEAEPGDWLARAAQFGGGNRLDVAWNQVVLRAREAGLALIEQWDVRQVAKLIALFPECVPAKYRSKPLTCYMADNEDCDWLVEIANAA